MHRERIKVNYGSFFHNQEHANLVYFFHDVYSKKIAQKHTLIFPKQFFLHRHSSQLFCCESFASDFDPPIKYFILKDELQTIESSENNPLS